MRVLHLTILRHWFAAIASGKKREEYRFVTPYWEQRLADRVYDEVHFRNGYNRNSPWMRVKWLGVKFGEFRGQRVFVISLGEILEVRNWPLKGQSAATILPESLASLMGDIDN